MDVYSLQFEARVQKTTRIRALFTTSLPRLPVARGSTSCPAPMHCSDSLMHSNTPRLPSLLALYKLVGPRSITVNS